MRSCYGWNRTDAAPRPVLLALFWETRFGRSLLDADTHNGFMAWKQHAAALDRENTMLRLRIAYLERVGYFGSANAPLITAIGP